MTAVSNDTSPSGTARKYAHDGSRRRSRRGRGGRRCRSHLFLRNGAAALLAMFLVAATVPPATRDGGAFLGRLLVDAANDDYYNDDAGGDDANAGDDAAAADDDAAAGDDAVAGDDAAVAVVNDRDDDYFEWDESLGFEGVSIMPVSCVNYNNGHMIKFQFFESSGNYNCHFKNLGTFVVSIAHYMRAYFNYQALINGKEFSLPGDVGFLNCVPLQETAYTDQQLYAKVGCLERGSFTSTKLQLHVYEDDQCSQLYDDGQTAQKHATDGYLLDGYYFSSKVSFRPPFYSCQSCSPAEISETFTKRNTYWYDDDVISNGGQKQFDDDGQGDDANKDDVYDDDQKYDDYFSANDDVGGSDDDQAAYYNNDDGNNDQYAYVRTDDGPNKYKYQDHDDDFYTLDDDGAGNGRVRGRELAASTRTLTAAKGELEAYEADFWNEMERITRGLEDANADVDDNNDIGDWNMCQRVYKYGLWCDQECRELDTFRVDEWSRSDIFLLVIMCVFMGAMMLLVFAKRVKAYEKAIVYADDLDAPNPGLPPVALFMIFVLILTIVLVLASLKFVNETLVFAVVTCILLFIYMLKLTLFENKSPQLLPARSARNGLDAMNRHLFDS